ncbi:SMI1/KNR4 family protein [Chryseobacterium sp. RP-3-3]|uniref:SMI1/KNR4 family protein n=1 Tax=Chryseobacterium antibioticum TaxID=2728847 RepID=A0A7Y0AJ11_9FLAO|nr:SMI1/KNR4 family protein [Chryseobacterium antibioticum]NML68244.1 SMI1/KNR4 family protein [Chryseobacterium antibioticum]
MILQKLIEKFISLSEGKLTAQEWMDWFTDHKDTVEKICGRTAFLKIKTKESFSAIRNAYIGQLGAFEWLQSVKINTTFSDLYKKGWEKEFEDFCKAEKQKEKQLQKDVEKKFGYLKDHYPKFFRQLTRSYSDSDIIEAGVQQEFILNKEKELSMKIPEDLTTWYQNVSILKLEGIDIDFQELSTETIEKKQYLILGEFWLYGDGDQLLYSLENQNIYIFAHEHSPPKVIKIANSLSDFVEKKMVTYLNEYES